MTYRSENDTSFRKALVLGCGGTLGFAWTAAVLDALHAKAGWDPREADVLVGTSAGAEAVAMLGAGIPAKAILDAVAGVPGGDAVVAAHVRRVPDRLPPVPYPRWPAAGLVRAALRRDVDTLAGLAGLLPRGRGDAGWLRELGDALAPGGWVPHPATWLMAADLTGKRIALGSPDAPPARLGEVAAHRTDEQRRRGSGARSGPARTPAADGDDQACRRRGTTAARGRRPGGPDRTGARRSHRHGRQLHGRTTA
ncbi:hypothetical protein [Amycolatopsis sp. NPDC102389]|uniref:hypothetical protein n=1 Tax=Amycolatopsis sp. NPDC102389 TaxID=3363941 RepID=UPI00380288F1